MAMKKKLVGRKKRRVGLNPFRGLVFKGGLGRLRRRVTLRRTTYRGGLAGLRRKK
jgi:hypothetical protein